MQDVVPSQAKQCEVEWMDAEDTLFLLYTSGSTGKPKVKCTIVFVECKVGFRAQGTGIILFR